MASLYQVARTFTVNDQEYHYYPPEKLTESDIDKTLINTKNITL